VYPASAPCFFERLPTHWDASPLRCRPRVLYEIGLYLTQRKELRIIRRVKTACRAELNIAKLFCNVRRSLQFSSRPVRATALERTWVLEMGTILYCSPDFNLPRAALRRQRCLEKWSPFLGNSEPTLSPHVWVAKPVHMNHTELVRRPSTNIYSVDPLSAPRKHCCREPIRARACKRLVQSHPLIFLISIEASQSHAHWVEHHTERSDWLLSK
jgi:hypothetical protein